MTFWDTVGACFIGSFGALVTINLLRHMLLDTLVKKASNR